MFSESFAPINAVRASGFPVLTFLPVSRIDLPLQFNSRQVNWEFLSREAKRSLAK